MKSIFILALSLSCAATAALANPANDIMSERNAEFFEAVNAADADAVAGFYTEDAKIGPPGEGIISGREAIAEYWDSILGKEIAAARHVPGDYEMPSEDMIVEMSGYELLDADGNVMGGGRAILTWRKVDGEWMITRDLWN